MSQTDFDVANGTGSAVRADINAHLDAAVSLSAGASAPSTTFPNQFWYDTTLAVLKRRNNANTVWQNHLDGKEGADVASSGTTEIWTSDGDTIHITGTTTITSLGTAVQVGTWKKLIFDGAVLLTDGANLNLPGGVDYTTVADDFVLVYAETLTLFKVLIFPVSGLSPVNPIESIIIAIGDETTDITTGTAKVTIRMPYAFELLAGNAGVRASLNTVSSSGIPTIDINLTGTGTIMDTTKLTIDASELTSLSAAAEVALSTTTLADDDELTFDIDVAGTGAKGLKVMLRGRKI